MASPEAPAAAANPVVMRLRRESLLIFAPYVWRGAADNHRCHPTSESGETNHNDVNRKEEHEGDRDEEVYGARGLLAAQNSDRGRNRGRDGGGHGQARPDDQRKEDENDEQVGEPLKYVIRPGSFLIRPPEAQMLGDFSRGHLPGDV